MPAQQIERSSGAAVAPADTTNHANIKVDSSTNELKYNSNSTAYIAVDDTNNQAAIAGNKTFTGTVKVNAGGSTTRAIPVVVLDSQFSIAGVGNAADTTDDTLFTFSVPAATLGTNGFGIRVRASGVTAANGNNKTVKIIYGATTVATTGVVTSNNKAWSAEAIIVRTAATTQLSMGNTSADGTYSATKAAPAETLSGAVTVKVTGASPTTGAASDVLGHTWMVEMFAI